jgi:hypothetical protein
LRGDIEALKTRERAALRIPAPRAPQPDPVEASAAALDADLIPASEWKNIGRATPEAALETAMWAAVGGDMDALAEAIHLDPDTRAKIEEAMQGLPERLRGQYGTPERLLAFMVARDIPATAMRIAGPEQITQGELPPDVTALKLKTQKPGSSPRVSTLMLQRFDGAWQLDVPPGVINRYLNKLAGTSSQAAPPQGTPFPP